MTKDDLKQIVIIGGGAAGLQLATKLGHKLGKNKLANIILIDKNLSYLWKPLWHEVAAGRIDVMKDKTEYLAHGNAHGFNFIVGDFADLDRKNKIIKLNKTSFSEQEAFLPAKIHYDYLVLALGSVHNNFNTPGVDEHCITFDNLSECEYFHDKLMFQLLKLFQSPNQELNIAIIGGGSTGVELAFEIKGTIHELFTYNNIDKENLKVNLSIIESSPSILANLDDELIAESSKQLSEQEVMVYCHEKVTKVDSNFIYTESGKMIKAEIKLWSAGIKAPDCLTKLGLSLNQKNQILIRDSLQLLEDDSIFAIGDCANFPDKQKILPATAQLAHQQADFLANSLTSFLIEGNELANFNFKQEGTIVSIGNSKAVGEVNNTPIGKVKLNKRFAYLSYRFLYRKYQAALYGWVKVTFLIISDFFARRVRPRVKFH